MKPKTIASEALNNLTVGFADFLEMDRLASDALLSLNITVLFVF